MKIQPPTEELKQLFEQVIAGFPEAQPRKMFGQPCAFVNDQIVTGLLENQMMLRLSPEDRQVYLEKVEGAKPFAMEDGRTMREYVNVPPALLAAPEALNPWLCKAIDYTKTLPPKKPKPARRKA